MKVTKGMRRSFLRERPPVKTPEQFWEDVIRTVIYTYECRQEQLVWAPQQWVDDLIKEAVCAPDKDHAINRLEIRLSEFLYGSAKGAQPDDLVWWQQMCAAA